MSKLIKEIENDIAALNAKLNRVKLLEDKFEFCDDGCTIFCDGGTGASGMINTKDFAALYKTEKQATKRRRMLYLQNVEFQLAEHFNGGEEYDWDDTSTKYNIAFDTRVKDYLIMNANRYRREGASYFVSHEAAEKALPYYIEAVERYDRGEV